VFSNKRIWELGIKLSPTRSHYVTTNMVWCYSDSKTIIALDGCIVWNAHSTVLGLEALQIHIVPVCYVKTGRYGKT